MSTSYVVRNNDARRVARAIKSYQLTRPSFWVSCAAVMVGGFAAGIAYGIGVAVLFALILPVVLVAIVASKLRKAEAGLIASGLRPGNTLAVALEADGLGVASAKAFAKYEYPNIRSVAQRDGVVLVQLRAPRVVIGLPGELFPAGAAADLAARVATAGRVPA